ncbi:MAG TPA: saccharopine dehydrogenase NADP-binding domain-containing protein [Dongiaceae bacterium]|nr:saccharopine dehydrogenase NADP-binding domain-containing protein [Dongiaceae bacterium]
MDTRPYDIILWGATGFTGRQATRYLHEQYGKPGNGRSGGLRWAIAGRDRVRLEAVRAWAGAPELPILIVPGRDAGAAEQMARSTRVVCATVAPAAEYATEMVAACARHGTDYCDLSGELHWLRAMIDRYDNEAKASGARILNACGFDSIPSDLGVQFLQEQAKAQFGEYCNLIRNCFDEGHIAVSGGSFASGLGVMRAVAKDPQLANLIADPNSLNPRDRMRGAFRPELDRVVHDKDFGQYLMPFPIGGINTRIVRRSHALTNFQYGEDFIYEEAKLAGNGLLSKTRAQVENFFTQLFVAGNPESRFTRFLHGLGPKVGDGPTDEQIARNGPFSFRMIGYTPSGKQLRAKVFCARDPGHGGTAAMLGDTAYCLAMERDKTGRIGGFTTTSVALGSVLRERLRGNTGLEFSVEGTSRQSAII